ncbi:nuclear prelamin A recognition factor-like protein [Coprinopsis sp. MPI-PUGE-AT-0042]|nr:nuclear prelamin A recognition factor-like protein [Coprinopsis sp. MPI-PUGE-AT-0042]
MAFSGALTLTDLNDFISPSQACIKPVEQTNKPDEEPKTGAKTEIVVDATGGYYEVDNTPGPSVALNTTTPAPSSGQKLEQAQINLNDCLACSGCITSAESVLITLQSHAEVFKFVEENRTASPQDQKVLVLSIAPQPLASLAASLSTTTPTTPLQVLRRVRAFAKDALGCSEVFDTTFSRHIALREHVLEFEERKAKDQLGGEEAEGQLPMLASACPGWICYAEKAHAEMLPFVSRTKSPQQIMGTLVKEWMAKKWGKTPDGVYHVSVMPCYDKKLEASRQDFYNEIYSTRDVDCVITTGELDLMMKEKGFDIAQPIPGELLEEAQVSLTLSASTTQSESGVIRLPDLIQHPGSSSGSYLQAVIEHVKESSAVPLAFASKQMRNADYEEVTLTDETTGRVVFKGAKCYGFRNLQNVVRKVGRDKGVRVGGGAAGKLAGRSAGAGRRIARKGAATGAGGATGEGNRQYDYVEVMACPGGCVNGGGQLKPIVSASTHQSDSNANGNGNTDEEGFSRNWEESGVMQSSAKWGDKDWTRKVEEAYWSGPLSSGRGNEQEQQHEEADGRIEMCRGRGVGDRDTRNGLGNHSELQELLKPDLEATVDALNGPHDTLRIDISEGQVIGGGGARRGDDADDDDDLDQGNRVKTVKKSLDDRIGGLEPGTWPRGQGQARRRFELVQSLAERILEEMVRDKEGQKHTQSRQRFLRTQYHAVESEVIGLAVKW